MVPLAAAADANTVLKRDAKTKPEINDGNLGQCLSPPTSYYVDSDQVQQYWCRKPTIVNGTVVDGEYNEGEWRRVDVKYNKHHMTCALYPVYTMKLARRAGSTS